MGPPPSPTRPLTSAGSVPSSPDSATGSPLPPRLRMLRRLGAARLAVRACRLAGCHRSLSSGDLSGVALEPAAEAGRLRAAERVSTPLMSCN